MCVYVGLSFISGSSDFHHSGVGKWVVIHATTWITRVATIKRQTSAAFGCSLLAAGQGPWAQAEPTAYRLYAHSVCDMNSVLDMVLGRYPIQIHLLTRPIKQTNRHTTTTTTTNTTTSMLRCHWAPSKRLQRHAITYSFTYWLTILTLLKYIFVKLKKNISRNISGKKFTKFYSINYL